MIGTLGGKALTSPYISFLYYNLGKLFASYSQNVVEKSATGVSLLDQKIRRFLYSKASLFFSILLKVCRY